jgi:hypothetical protein
MNIQSHTKIKSETSDLARERLKRIYNSGYNAYLNKLKKKYDKILKSFTKFKEFNEPIFGNKIVDLEYCETNLCFNEGSNISNIPSVFKVINEKAKKMQNFVQRLLDRINSRIYKTREIKNKWRDQYSDLSAQDPLKIDYSIYPSDDIASNNIFTEIFEEQKIGSGLVLNPAVNN